MIRSQALKLPVGDAPDWEVGGSDSEPSDLKSPAERQAGIHRSMCDPADPVQLCYIAIAETMLGPPIARA